MLGEELLRSAKGTRDHRRWHEAGKVEHPDFLGRVAHRGRVIDHEGLAPDPLEQVRCGDIAEVERRVLAHQHDVDVAAEVEDREFPEREVIAGDRLDGDFAHAGVEPAFFIGQVFGEIVIELVAELLRLQHQREGRIAGDVDPSSGSI